MFSNKRYCTTKEVNEKRSCKSEFLLFILCVGELPSECNSIVHLHQLAYISTEGGNSLASCVRRLSCHCEKAKQWLAKHNETNVVHSALQSVLLLKEKKRIVCINILDTPLVYTASSILFYSLRC